jgi:hypothetical protein
MQYESEKLVATYRNGKGKNQYTLSFSIGNEITPNNKKETHRKIYPHVTAQRIANENRISSGTVQKYALYTRALETIGNKVPDFVPKILSGRYKISHDNVVELSKLNPNEIERVGRSMEKNQQPFLGQRKTKKGIKRKYEQSNSADTIPVTSVKDMPAFDPDAEINALALTVPSWGSSIERTRMNANLNVVTNTAKMKLLDALERLQEKITIMLETIKEK